jgi:hypothetical protein
MTVWFAVVASISHMYMFMAEDECSTAFIVILAIMYASAFIGGMLYDSNQKDRIKKLEDEVKKLKENNKEI